MSMPKPPSREKLDQVIEFLDQQLRPTATWSIKDEYPLVFSEANRGNIRFVEDEQNNEILSHAVSKYLITKTPIGIFKVAAIGSVVTNPMYRNKGYSREVLASSLEAAKKHGCDFAILWTDLYDFYRKIGFELAGSEVSLTLNDNFHPPTPLMRIECTSKVSAESLLSLYNNHRVGTIRNIHDMSAYLKIPNMKVYTAWDANNKLLAYAVEGKGADLSGYIHEWGGGVTELMALFKHIQTSQRRNITVISPGHSENLIRQCKDAGAFVNNGYLGMIQLLDTRNLFFKIKRYARSLGFDNFVMEQQGKSYCFGDGQNKLYRTDQASDLIRLLFGPYQSQDIYNFDEHTKKVLSQLFPIPMWIWGWDSI
ncbi:MAG: GNAT family N-acetyltransferase [Bdellovibrionales bacterium]|nr:GNAT family N-acetyltransferase [Bdellovibrionales bacterium]